MGKLNGKKTAAAPVGEAPLAAVATAGLVYVKPGQVLAEAPAARVQPTDLLRIGDVARQYRVNERTVREWVRAGLVPYVLVGPFKVKYIPREALETHVPAKSPGGPR